MVQKKDSTDGEPHITMWRNKALSWAIFYIALISGNAFAGEYAPAKFKSGTDAPESIIEFPDIEHDGKWLVRCMATIRSTGRPARIYCYEPGADRGLDRKLVDAITNVRSQVSLTPAYVDGKPKTVWFSFSVSFQKDGDQQRVEFYSSHLFDYDKYGKSYTGPQRIIVSAGGGRRSGCRQLKMLGSANIDMTGFASNVSVKLIDGTAKMTSKCKRNISTFLARGSYIPATLDGEYVSAKFEEMFW